MIVPLDSVLTRRDCISQGDVHLLEGKQMYSLFNVLMRSEGPSFKINSDCPSFWGWQGLHKSSDQTTYFGNGLLPISWVSHVSDWMGDRELAP